jgi:hypothetical protein
VTLGLVDFLEIGVVADHFDALLQGDDRPTGSKNPLGFREII